MNIQSHVMTALIAAGLLVPAGAQQIAARQSQSSGTGQSQTTTSSGTSNTSGQSQSSSDRQTNSPQGQTSGHGTGTGSGQQSGSSMSATSDSKKSGMQSGSSISSADRKFMMEAAIGGMKEVELGRVAATKATNPEIKQFAQKMVDEHSKVNEELKTLAASKGVTLPAAPDARLQATMAKMESLSGAEFDRAYIKEAGVKEHQKAERLFRDESTRGKDPETRAFAAKVLPAVQHHLTEVRGLESSMAGSRTSSGASSDSGSSSSGSGTSDRSGNSGSTSGSGSSTGSGSTSSGSGSSTGTSSGQSGQGNQGGSTTKPQ